MSTSELAEQISNGEMRIAELIAMRDRPESSAALVDALIPLLIHPDEDVRDAVEHVFRTAGPEVAPALRIVRRQARGPLRRSALDMLACVVGFDGLDPSDQAAIRRLIEIKALDEVPEPIEDIDDSWYAVPTSDQAGVLDALDLSDPALVTMQLGESAWRWDRHDWGKQLHHRCRRTYVSPVLDGWTLAFGSTPAEAHLLTGDPDAQFPWIPAVFEVCRKLSRRFGEAHWYAVDIYGWSAWCIAREGEIVRYFNTSLGEQEIGERLPEERGYRLPNETFPDSEDEEDDEAAFQAFLKLPSLSATTLAGKISVDPGALGPDTTVRGRGVLALTECGRESGMPRGSLWI